MWPRAQQRSIAPSSGLLANRKADHASAIDATDDGRPATAGKPGNRGKGKGNDRPRHVHHQPFQLNQELPESLEQPIDGAAIAAGEAPETFDDRPSSRSV